MTTSFVGAPSQETPEKWWDWEKEKQITDESGAYGRFISAGHYEAINAENAALRADAERYRWLKECTIEQFDYLSNNWCGLDNEIDSMMKIERSGDYYASASVMKCKHVFEDDRCVVCGGVA